MKPTALSQAGAVRCRRKFLCYFKRGYDDTYVAWERGYGGAPRDQWNEVLDRQRFKALYPKKEFAAIVARAPRIESSRAT